MWVVTNKYNGREYLFTTLSKMALELDMSVEHLYYQFSRLKKDRFDNGKYIIRKIKKS